MVGDGQRGVVRQHDPARTDADFTRSLRDVADRHRSGGAGDPNHVVMLGEPIAMVAPALGMLGEIA